MDFNSFVEELITLKGFGSEDAEVKAQLEKDLEERIESKIQAMILSNMHENDLDEFESLLDSGSEPQIQTFLQERIPNFDEKVAGELAMFKANYLA